MEMARIGLKGQAAAHAECETMGTDDVSEPPTATRRKPHFNFPFPWALGWFSLLPNLCEYPHGWSQHSIRISLNFRTKAASRNPTPSPKSPFKRYSDIEQDFWKSYLFFWNIH
jgi:hypothetical protein